MYVLLFLVPAAFAGAAIWRLSGRARWRRPARLLAAALTGVLTAVLLCWGALVLAIYAWQWSDPVTW